MSASNSSSVPEFSDDRDVSLSVDEQTRRGRRGVSFAGSAGFEGLDFKVARRGVFVLVIIEQDGKSLGEKRW